MSGIIITINYTDLDCKALDPKVDASANNSLEMKTLMPNIQKFRYGCMLWKNTGSNGRIKLTVTLGLNMKTHWYGPLSWSESRLQS